MNWETEQIALFFENSGEGLYDLVLNAAGRYKNNIEQLIVALKTLYQEWEEEYMQIAYTPEPDGLGGDFRIIDWEELAEYFLSIYIENNNWADSRPHINDAQDYFPESWQNQSSILVWSKDIEELIPSKLGGFWLVSADIAELAEANWEQMPNPENPNPENLYVIYKQYPGENWGWNNDWDYNPNQLTLFSGDLDMNRPIFNPSLTPNLEHDQAEQEVERLGYQVMVTRTNGNMICYDARIPGQRKWYKGPYAPQDRAMAALLGVLTNQRTADYFYDWQGYYPDDGSLEDGKANPDASAPAFVNMPSRGRACPQCGDSKPGHMTTTDDYDREAPEQCHNCGYAYPMEYDDIGPAHSPWHVMNAALLNREEANIVNQITSNPQTYSYVMEILHHGDTEPWDFRVESIMDIYDEFFGPEFLFPNTMRELTPNVNWGKITEYFDNVAEGYFGFMDYSPGDTTFPDTWTAKIAVWEEEDFDKPWEEYMVDYGDYQPGDRVIHTRTGILGTIIGRDTFLADEVNYRVTFDDDPEVMYLIRGEELEPASETNGLLDENIRFQQLHDLWPPTFPEEWKQSSIEEFGEDEEVNLPEWTTEQEDFINEQIFNQSLDWANRWPEAINAAKEAQRLGLDELTTMQRVRYKFRQYYSDQFRNYEDPDYTKWATTIAQRDWTNIPVPIPMPDEESLNELWPDVLPWGEDEQNYYRTSRDFAKSNYIALWRGMSDKEYGKWEKGNPILSGKYFTTNPRMFYVHPSLVKRTTEHTYRMIGNGRLVNDTIEPLDTTFDQYSIAKLGGEDDPYTNDTVYFSEPNDPKAFRDMSFLNQEIPSGIFNNHKKEKTYIMEEDDDFVPFEE